VRDLYLESGRDRSLQASAIGSLSLGYEFRGYEFRGLPRVRATQAIGAS
jgi:hypothetical protein